MSFLSDEEKTNLGNLLRHEVFSEAVIAIAGTMTQKCLIPNNADGNLTLEY